MKLREAISEYTKWVAAVWAAAARQHITPIEAQTALDDIKRELRRWVGEDLLNKEL